MLLEFYRAQASRLTALETSAKAGETVSTEDRAEEKRLRTLLTTAEPAFSLASLLESQSDAIITSSDPTWERYVQLAKSTSITDLPTEWFTGPEGQRARERLLAAEQGK